MIGIPHHNTIQKDVWYHISAILVSFVRHAWNAPINEGYPSVETVYTPPEGVGETDNLSH